MNAGVYVVRCDGGGGGEEGGKGPYYSDMIAIDSYPDLHNTTIDVGELHYSN